MARGTNVDSILCAETPNRLNVTIDPKEPLERVRAGIHEHTVERISSKGIPAEMKLYRDIKDSIKAAWSVDLIELHTQTGPAGYLKVSYIPQETFERYFNDPFAYSVWEGGQHDWRLRPQLLKAEQSWSRSELLQAFIWTDGYRTSEDEKLHRERLSDQELLAEWRSRRQRLGDQVSVDYEKFRDFHLDRPVIDYVRVCQGDGSPCYQDGRRQDSRFGGIDQRRQGLAVLMYETAAIWVAERGLRLHASGLQSEPAAGVWKSFEQRGLVEHVGDRRLFDTDALLSGDPSLDFAAQRD